MRIFQENRSGGCPVPCPESRKSSHSRTQWSRKKYLASFCSGNSQSPERKYPLLESDCTHLPVQSRVQSGMVLVPQGGRVFPNLTVRENLDLGAYTVNDSTAIEKALDLVYETFPVLKQRATQKAGTMSGGERQMLAIARAMMSQPKLLMLDEPSLGLAPLVVKELMEKIHSLSVSLGMTVLIVEQNVQAAFKIVERVYVLKLGKIAFEEKPDVLLQDERLRKAYLG